MTNHIFNHWKNLSQDQELSLKEKKQFLGDAKNEIENGIKSGAMKQTQYQEELNFIKYLLS